MSDVRTTAIPLTLTPLEAKALEHFVKRVDFETVARRASVTIISNGKSEADLIWLALIELRRALAEAGVAPQARPSRAAPLSVVQCRGKAGAT